MLPGGFGTSAGNQAVRLAAAFGNLPPLRSLERVTCLDAPNIIKTKAAIKKAFQNQIDGKGFSLVEIMSACPTNWGLSPLDSIKFMREKTMVEFQIGRASCRERV